MEYTLRNGTIASHGEKAHNGDLSVKGKIIAAGGGGVSISLKDSCVYPALINTHDHLQGNYTPPVGPPEGTFYHNWLPWDNDLKASQMFKERSQLSRENLYALSGYKCLFSGVATVNDHFPHAINREILPTLPVRAILEYGLAHECSSYDLKWGDGIEIEHARAVENKWPFITHLNEGFDDEARDGVRILERLKVLDSHCLLVHCISFDDSDIQKVAQAGASVSWCGKSNMRMFNATARIRDMLNAGINVTIGTDSAATGSINFLAELKYDRELYRSLYGEDLPAETMLDMVTHNAAKAFWMLDRTGTLDEGKWADILVLKSACDDPYENLVEAGLESVELLVLEGVPIYGELRFLDIFGGDMPSGYSQIEVGGRPLFVKGDPAGLYKEVREKVGFKKELGYLPFEP